jgi:hypothetical protein
VKIRNKKVAFVLVLELNPVVESTHIVAKVKPASGPHAAEDAGTL